MKAYRAKPVNFKPQKEGSKIKTIKRPLEEIKFAKDFPEEFKEYLFNKYGDNDWWNSKDDLTKVYYQTNEPKLALKMNEYQFALSRILKFTIYTHHFGSRKTLKETGLYGMLGEMCWEEIQDRVNKIWKEKHESV